MLGKTELMGNGGDRHGFQRHSTACMRPSVAQRKSKEMRCGMHPAVSHSVWNFRALARYWEMGEWHVRCVPEDSLVGAAGLPQELVG